MTAAISKRRPSGAKAQEAHDLAVGIVAAQKVGNVTAANALYEKLCRLVTKGNAAYHILSAENEGK